MQLSVIRIEFVNVPFPETPPALSYLSSLYVRIRTGKHLPEFFAGFIIFSARGMHYFCAPRYSIQSNIFSQLVITRTQRNVLFISKLCRLFLGQQTRSGVHLFFSSFAWKKTIPSIYGILIRVSFRSFYHHRFYLLYAMRLYVKHLCINVELSAGIIFFIG